jgi:hypothetical protein
MAGLILSPWKTAIISRKNDATVLAKCPVTGALSLVQICREHCGDGQQHVRPAENAKSAVTMLVQHVDSAKSMTLLAPTLNKKSNLPVIPSLSWSSMFPANTRGAGTPT